MFDNYNINIHIPNPNEVLDNKVNYAKSGKITMYPTVYEKSREMCN